MTPNEPGTIDESGTAEPEPDGEPTTADLDESDSDGDTGIDPDYADSAE